MTEKYFIIYDGSCNFCNKMIMFIANNDKYNNFIFVSNFSEFGTKLLLKHNIKGLEKATIILVENKNEISIKSVAIRKVLLKIPYYKMIGYLMFLFPKTLSDYMYDMISKNRSLIIKNNICEIPNNSLKKN
jgi:predicted DCC family thiol-disulfide oxidoreductase YuxK